MIILYDDIEELPREIQDEVFEQTVESVKEESQMLQDTFKTACQYVLNEILTEKPNEHEALPICVVDGTLRYMDFEFLGKVLLEMALYDSGQSDMVDHEDNRTRISGEAVVSGLSYLLAAYMIGNQDISEHNEMVDKINDAIRVAKANGIHAESPLVYLDRMQNFAMELEDL